ncbi:MAG: hypothetical protein J6S21_04155 [Victivallales bacterium]|nr:hypothetical protein [Victivallales bacterium]
MEIHRCTYKARYAEGNREGLLKLRSFFDLAQEAAGDHAALLGVGMEAQLARNQAWMLSRAALRITRYPRFGEMLTVTTWPAGFDRMLARREVRFADAGGVLAEMTMLWMIVDTAAMSIIPAPKALGTSLPDNPELPRAFESMGKLPAPAEPEVLRCTIRESQLDINCHLNNAEYAALIQDALGAGSYPAELQINFQRGIPPQGEVKICGGIDGKNFAFAGYCGGNTAFTASGTLR